MFTIALITILIVYSVWWIGTRNFGYWKKKGVKHEKPVFFFGNMYKQFMQRVSMSELLTEMYEKYPDEKYIGVHMANDLGLILRDPELIKRVLVADFKYFHRRGMNSHKQVVEPLFRNLFTADGDIWKLVRQRLTPAFTSGKLKGMFPMIERTAGRMLTVAKPGIQDVRELLARYTTDFIGTCGFGMDFDSLNDDSSIFRRLGRRIFKITPRDAFVLVMKRIAPELFKDTNYLSSEIQTNTFSIVKQILKQRNYTPSGRNDFIDLLLELKQKGKIVGDSVEYVNPDGTPKTVELELDDMMIAAQVFVFFAAGFETSSSASSFLLHELAFNPEIQERCHKEIDEVLSRHGGRITYDAVKEMKYLELAFKETLRLHPSPGFLMRRCNKKYTFPGTTLTVDEDVFVLVPLIALQRDPRYFKDPETFMPERFQDGENAYKYTFMPFGEGARSCIGARLGLMQSLAGAATLLNQFRVEPAPTTQRHPLIDPQSFVADNIQGGLPLTLIPRKRA